MIALLALLGCAGSKPVANAGDDPLCKEFYEYVNNSMSTEEFESFKQSAKKFEYKFDLNEKIDVFAMFIFQREMESSNTHCNKIITCSQKDYCISILTRGDTLKLFEF